MSIVNSRFSDLCFLAHDFLLCEVDRIYLMQFYRARFPASFLSYKQVLQYNFSVEKISIQINSGLMGHPFLQDKAMR